MPSQLLYWYPATDAEPHQRVVSRAGGFGRLALSPAQRGLVDRSSVKTFGQPRLELNLGEVDFRDVPRLRDTAGRIITPV